ncbi:MAG: glycosyltransferase family 39 protein [Mariprofundaceae bacterium]|nr:glycosyltransferase family 39 protein [Mariprofundaceae bacterium]
MAARPVTWLLLLCAVNFAFMLGGHSLWDVDEPNNAVCAREMLAAGNWWVPVFNGDLRFDKPILLYWLMMPLFHVFGVHEWTARLPSVMAISSLVLVVFYFGRRMADVRTGLIAALLLVSSLHIVVIARAATPDPLLMLCIGFALSAFLCFYLEEMENYRLLIAAYVMLGFGVLAKGPVAILLPALVMLVFLLMMGQRENIRKFRPVIGLCVILAVALPWYITVGVLTDGEWLKGFLLHHNIDRFTGTLQGHRGFPGFYILTFLGGWFPWSGLLAAALGLGAWKRATLQKQPVRLFLLCWIGVFFIFFTLASTRLPNYMLPAFPAAALMMAFWIRGHEEQAGNWLTRGALALSFSVIVGAGIALQIQWPGEWVYALCFLPLFIATFASIRLKLERSIPMIAAGMAASVIFLAGWGLPVFEHHKVTPELAAAANRAGFDGKSLATFRYFQPSLLYYHGGRLPMLANMHDVSVWLMQGKAVVLPQGALAEFPSAILPYLVIHKRSFGMVARKWLLLVSYPVKEHTISESGRDVRQGARMRDWQSQFK